MSIAEFTYTVLLKPAPLRCVANAIIRAIIPKTLVVRGAKISLNPRDPVVSGALAIGVYEKDEIEFFCTYFRSGMTFVDVGANSGLYTALALSKNSKVVLAVEPHPESREFLEQTIEFNSNDKNKAFISSYAAFDKKTSAILYENPDNKGDNRIYANPLCSMQEKIETNTLESICNECNINSIDFLKIDTQGAELRVIKAHWN